MSSGIEREEEFAAILDAAEGDNEALAIQARIWATGDPEFSATLALAARLRRVSAPRAERDQARMAVGQRLARAILSGEGEQASLTRSAKRLRHSFPEASEPSANPPISDEREDRPTSTPEQPTAPAPALRAFTPTRRRPARQRDSRRRAGLAVLAAAIALIALVSGLSVASAASLPESPLYGVKRFEESALLVLPVSEATHANLLGSFALRRLTEAQVEARAGHDHEAMTLLDEYRNDMLQLIALAADSGQSASDRLAVTAQIAHLLKAQELARTSAASRGDASFSAALTSSANAISGALQQQNVTLPPASGKPTDTPNSQGSIDTTVTPGASATPGHGKGHGNGNGNGNGGAQPTPGSGNARGG